MASRTSVLHAPLYPTCGAVTPLVAGTPVQVTLTPGSSLQSRRRRAFVAPASGPEDREAHLFWSSVTKRQRHPREIVRLCYDDSGRYFIDAEQASVSFGGVFGHRSLFAPGFGWTPHQLVPIGSLTATAYVVSTLRDAHLDGSASSTRHRARAPPGRPHVWSLTTRTGAVEGLHVEAGSQQRRITSGLEAPSTE